MGRGVWAGELGTGTGRHISHGRSSARRRVKATVPLGEFCCHGEQGGAEGARCPACVQSTLELAGQEGTGKAMGPLDGPGCIWPTHPPSLYREAIFWISHEPRRSSWGWTHHCWGWCSSGMLAWPAGSRFGGGEGPTGRLSRRSPLAVALHSLSQGSGLCLGDRESRAHPFLGSARTSRGPSQHGMCFLVWGQDLRQGRGKPESWGAESHMKGAGGPGHISLIIIIIIIII